MISCFVIDDEFSAIQILTEYISITPGLKTTMTFESPLMAMETFREGQLPDLIFLDINMPNFSGLQLANYIPKDSKIVFTSAYSKFGVEAFECQAIDYLLKPISYERFIKCVEKFKAAALYNQPTKDDDHFFIQSELKGKLIRINFEDFIFAESIQNYLRIHTLNASYVTYLKLHELQSSLPAEKFSRVHKSFIINNKKIVSVEKNSIHLFDNQCVSVGDSSERIFLVKLKTNY